MLAHKIGKQIIPGRREVHRAGADRASTPRSSACGRTIGMRVKLAARGAGRWQSSGGYRSKFGLTLTEILRGPRVPEAARHGRLLQAAALPPGQPDHQHPQHQGGPERGGPRLRRAAPLGAGLEYLDVGGGLGVDYDGSQTDFESSVNYTLQEYANDVVFHIKSVCDEAGVPHPTIISETGRAVVAYHSVLVFDVLGVSAQGENDVPPRAARRRRAAAGRPARDLQEPHACGTCSRAITTPSRRSTWR